MQNNDLPGGEGGIRTPGVAQNGPNQPHTTRAGQGRCGAIWGGFRSEFRSWPHRVTIAAAITYIPSAAFAAPACITPLGIAVGVLAAIAGIVLLTTGRDGWHQLARLLACVGVLLAGLLVPWQSFRRGALVQAVAATWRAWGPIIKGSEGDER